MFRVLSVAALVALTGPVALLGAGPAAAGTGDTGLSLQSDMSIVGDVRVAAEASTDSVAAQGGASSSTRFSFTPQYWFTNTDRPQTTLHMNVANVPAGTTARVLDGTGDLAWSQPMQSRVAVTMDWSQAEGLPAGQYRAEIVNAAGRVIDTSELNIVKDWSLLTWLHSASDPADMGVFPRCSTIRWWYDETGAPNPMSEEIEQVLTQLGDLAGLTIERAEQPEQANFQFEWEFMEDGPAGFGGYRFEDGRKLAFVSLNSGSEWARGESRLDRRALLRHEVLHAFGFGHVMDVHSLMNSFGGVEDVGPGELEGLNAVYAPQSCTGQDAPAKDTASVSIKVKRVTVRGKTFMKVTGTSRNINLATPLRPWVKKPGASMFTRSSARVYVNGDGKFTWKQRIGRSTKASVYFATEDWNVRSAAVTVR